MIKNTNSLMIKMKTTIFNLHTILIIEEIIDNVPIIKINMIGVPVIFRITC